MSGKTSPLSKTPPKQSSWSNGASSPVIGSPGCCSTPSHNQNRSSSFSCRKVSEEKGTPSKQIFLLGSPISKHNLNSIVSPLRCSQTALNDGETDVSSSYSRQINSTDASCNVKTFSSTESNGTLKVEFDFPHGGWDEDTSDESSSCNLEIVESEVECNTSVTRGRKRKQSEVSEEDNVILSGMGEEIERQLEAKAERNRLTVPNVKNILRSVITNPYVQAMVRRSIKSGDIAVSGDSDEVSFEPRMTRAKAKLLSDSNESIKMADLPWTSSPHKVTASLECQALIGEELNDDSDDDEEYHPCEDEQSDTEHSERDGSERGSERDISIDQSPVFCDADSESCPVTPTLPPRPNITDSYTQTNWSEDGVFKVPMAPPEPQVDQIKEENIALRTRSKLPLNDTPLEEIEQAFIPPDITPDLYDTTCDNADWQEFLKDFMQPMRSEPEVQNHDDDDEDPEYNVLADEEIIDKEELRVDRAVKVSKRELNELMRELMEYTENMSSDDEAKDKDTNKNVSSNMTSVKLPNPNNCSSGSDDMSLFLDAYISLGNLTPVPAQKTTPTHSRSPNTPSLNTPVPPMSPPCSRTPCDGSEGLCMKTDEFGAPAQTSDCKIKEIHLSENALSFESALHTSVKLDSIPDSPQSHYSLKILGKASSFVTPSIRHNERKREKSLVLEKPDCCSDLANGSGSTQKQNVTFTTGKPNSFPQSPTISSSSAQENQASSCSDSWNRSSVAEAGVLGLVGVNVAVPVTGRKEYKEHGENSFSSCKEFVLLDCDPNLEKNAANDSSYQPNADLANSDNNNWKSSNDERLKCENISLPIDETSHAEGRDEADESSDAESSDPELSVSLQMSGSPMATVEDMEEFITGDFCLTSTGDVMVENEVLLSRTQRLVLDQQLRQYVQFLTQHFLQTYCHPIHHIYATKCKKLLVSLNGLGEKKQKSAFKIANLQPALAAIKEWEIKLSSDDGPGIIRHMEEEVRKSVCSKKSRHRHYGTFSPQLMALMANSSAFVYPHLLPTSPFKSFEKVRGHKLIAAENQLLVMGLEQFTELIKQNNPKVKNCVKWALQLVTEYLLVGMSPTTLHYRLRYIKSNRIKERTLDVSSIAPVKYYFENNCAPPTSHYVIAFRNEDVVPLLSQPYHILPDLWRNYIYPALS